MLWQWRCVTQWYGERPPWWEPIPLCFYLFYFFNVYYICLWGWLKGGSAVWIIKCKLCLTCRGKRQFQVFGEQDSWRKWRFYRADHLGFWGHGPPAGKGCHTCVLQVLQGIIQWSSASGYQSYCCNKESHRFWTGKIETGSRCYWVIKASSFATFSTALYVFFFFHTVSNLTLWRLWQWLF